ncbi:MAG: hypothetical protein HZA93_28705 [Verrucomicrobia bacterium]|nr:hypothetical protein [Verrucomicrobiota bacterium]
MKRTTFAPLFTAISLLVASQPLLAASKKADARNAELVAALQAVSPDPLGGRLGLAAAATSAASQPAAKAGNAALQTRLNKADQVAYAQWKAERKS